MKSFGGTSSIRVSNNAALVAGDASRAATAFDLFDSAEARPVNFGASSQFCFHSFDLSRN